MDIGFLGTVSTRILVLYEHQLRPVVFDVASHKDTLRLVTVICDLLINSIARSY
jgi:hypothetical protein